MADYEAIMNALFVRLQIKLGVNFKTYSRRFQMYDDLVTALSASQAPEFPALYLFDGVGFGGGRTQWEQNNPGTPNKRTLDRTIVIYALQPGAGTPAGPDGTPGATVLHPLVTLVEAALDSDPVTNLVTLGGLVRHAWIEGEGHLISGDIDKSGLCMQTIPLRILIP